MIPGGVDSKAEEEASPQTTEAPDYVLKDLLPMSTSEGEKKVDYKMSSSEPLYTPLIEGEFRLLRIAEHVEPLSITLETFRLDTEPGYSAISYTWGLETDGQAEIICNGTKIVVWINLFHALHRLRDAVEAGAWLWIDALCINQIDLDEKAIQIPLMGTIYSQALEVIVWLGIATKEEEIALDEMSDIGEELGEMKYEIDDASVQIEQAIKILPAEHSPLWSHFWCLILRPWFNRIWSTQEIALTTTCSLLLGSDAVISWEAFTDLAGFVNMVQYHHKEYVHNHQKWVYDEDPSYRNEARSRLITHQGVEPADIDDIEALKTRFIENATGILHKVRIVRLLQLMRSGDELDGDEVGMEEHTHQMLQAFSGRGCTMDQDRVFAMLGMMIPRLKQGIAVDVKKSPEEVFIETSARWLKQDPHLSFLHWIKPHSKAPRFPSWCLDFRHVQGVTMLFFDGVLVDDDNHFSAGLIQQAKYQAAASERFVTGEEATIIGWHIDTVVAKIEPSDLHRQDWQSLLLPNARSDHREKALHWLEQGEKLANIASNPRRFEQYWRTLVLNGFGMESMEYGATDKHCHVDRSGDYQEMLRLLQREDLSTAVKHTDGARTFLDNIAHLSDMDLFVTHNGRLGRSEHGASIGDEVVIFRGARTPFLLRSSRDSKYCFRGEIYVHGIMYGEAFDSVESLAMKTYHIV